MASPATMEVTRIAALASETGVIALLVNPFTRPSIQWSLRREMGARASVACAPTLLEPGHIAVPNAPALPAASAPSARASSDPPHRGARGGAPPVLDHEATWLLGHTQQITFSELWEGEGDLYVEAVLHVRCRYLHEDGDWRSARPHGFEGRNAPRARREPTAAAARRRPVRGRGGPPECGVRELWPPAAPAGARRCHRRRESLRDRPLPHGRQHPQSRLLPGPAGRDHVHQAQRRLEALVRSRRSPYLCKIERAGRLLARGGDDLRLRLPGRRWRRLHPARPAAGRRPDRQARPLLRMAAQEPGAPPGLRLRAAPAAGRGTF